MPLPTYARMDLKVGRVASQLGWARLDPLVFSRVARGLDLVTTFVMHNAATRSLKPRSSRLGFWSSLARDQRGANLVEYIILVGVVALIALAGFQIFGGKVWDKAQKQAEAVGNIGD